jgi:hypothetical protein
MIRLSKITSKSKETVGSKAANLGELYKNLTWEVR